MPPSDSTLLRQEEYNSTPAIFENLRTKYTLVPQIWTLPKFCISLIFWIELWFIPFYNLLNIFWIDHSKKEVGMSV